MSDISVFRKMPWLDENEWLYLYYLLYTDATHANKRFALDHMRGKWQPKGELPNYIAGAIRLLELELCEPANLQDVFALGVVRFVRCVLGRTNPEEIRTECERLNFPHWLVEMANNIVRVFCLPSVEDLQDALLECHQWVKLSWHRENLKMTSTSGPEHISRMFMKVAILVYDEIAHREEIKLTLRKLSINYTGQMSFREIVDEWIAKGQFSLSRCKPAYVFSDVFEAMQNHLSVTQVSILEFPYSDLDYFLTVLDRVDCLHEFMAEMILVMRRSDTTMRTFISHWIDHIGEKLKKSKNGRLESDTTLDVEDSD